MCRKEYDKLDVDLLDVEIEEGFMASSAKVEEVTYKKNELGDYEEVNIYPDYIGPSEF